VQPIVPKLWPNSTIACIGSGPSLTQEDVEFCRGRARVVAINDAWRLAPFADVLWATDARWWNYHKGVPEFSGMKYALRVRGMSYPEGVTVLNDAGVTGLSSDPASVCNGKNGGYASIGLSVHLGATRIVLLGYDCKRGPRGEEHWHGRHPAGVRVGMEFSWWRSNFRTLVAPLRDLGIEVINCTPGSALDAFPRGDLRQALVALAQEVA
jgi:hypothetical protein